MSKLDRIFVLEGFLDMWDLKAQFIKSKSLFDHSPISMRSNKLDRAPKPFNFFMTWLDHPDFLPLVEEVWTKANVHGHKLFILKEKLKLLKSKLKCRNSKVSRKHELQVKEAINGVNKLNSIMVNDVNTS